MPGIRARGASSPPGDFDAALAGDLVGLFVAGVHVADDPGGASVRQRGYRLRFEFTTRGTYPLSVSRMSVGTLGTVEARVELRDAGLLRRDTNPARRARADGRHATADPGYTVPSVR